MNFAYAFSSAVCDIVFAGIFILLGIAIRLAGVKCYKSYKTRKLEKVLQNDFFYK